MDTVFVIQDKSSLDVITNALSIIFLFINATLAYFVIHEAIKMREIATSADVIYYLEVAESSISIIVENIGKAEAFNVHVEMDFQEGKPKLLPYTSFNYEYLAPNQKYKYFVGHILISMNINDRQLHVAGISSHKVKVQWFKKDLKKKFMKEYIITKEQAAYLYNRQINFKNIERKFDNLNRNIEKVESSISNISNTIKNKTIK